MTENYPKYYRGIHSVAKYCLGLLLALQVCPAATLTFGSADSCDSSAHNGFFAGTDYVLNNYGSAGIICPGLPEYAGAPGIAIGLPTVGTIYKFDGLFDLISIDIAPGSLAQREYIALQIAGYNTFLSQLPNGEIVGNAVASIVLELPPDAPQEFQTITLPDTFRGLRALRFLAPSTWSPLQFTNLRTSDEHDTTNAPEPGTGLLILAASSGLGWCRLGRRTGAAMLEVQKTTTPAP